MFCRWPDEFEWIWKSVENHLVNIGKSIGGSDWIFQQDNARIHRSKVNITWSKFQKINVLPWSSLSLI